MVAGKLSILLCSPVFADDLSNPQFFNYRGGSFWNQLSDFSFGWFKTLDNQQKAAHQSAVVHALMYADNGQKVTWYESDASGYAMPAMTWPSGSGYCRRLHIQAIAYNTEKTMTATACYSEAEKRWQWYNG
jgi:hypothetical protein